MRTLKREPFRRRAERAVGGRARLRVITLLAMVIALDGADKATVSVNADNLEQTFGLNHTHIGLLVSATSLAGALATLPAGVLTDRTTRTRLLAGSIVLWSVAMVGSAVAGSFGTLLAARVGLGVVTATAGPVVASLVGDYFPSGERAHLYGYILAGELFGTGFGYVVSTNIAALLSWRISFAWLALPGALLAWLLARLPEPRRGGRGQLAREEQQSPAAPGAAPATGSSARAVVRTARSEPRPEQVLREDPRTMSAHRAFAHILRIRTVLLMIAASALAYFFFAGVRSFGMLFVTHHYGVGRSTASGLVVVIGAGILAGLVAGARLPDVALRHGHASGRVLVPAVALLAAAPVFAPGILTSSALIAVPLLAVGAGLLAAANPPLDAARLDIVPPGLWGRSEAARTLTRSAAETTAPLLFGFLSSDVFDDSGSRTEGLRMAFLVCLAPLLAAGLLSLVALRTYPRDVATALASADAEATGKKTGGRVQGREAG
ncbi:MULTISPECIES: MFS transporter [unclassified Streptomyces]|uniref:MFS transporter n=1 Tax=unclassified Streptomyces TaxID=2593676 RepID=UPI0006910D60|nr:MULTISPECIES: MFS transporter [unclassified Streptomyces]